MGSDEVETRDVESERSPKAIPHTHFEKSLAIVIGINQYAGGIPVLRNATADARAVEKALEAHHFDVDSYYDEQATGPKLLDVFRELGTKVGKADRLVVYFAGHGLASDSNERASGYLLPSDAKPETAPPYSSYVDMTVIYEALEALPCRHVFVVLDCCFAGAFRWPKTRGGFGRAVVYRQSYERFIASPAWQALTSAADDQKALDAFVFEGRSDLEHIDIDIDMKRHSPFAFALLEGLKGKADHDEDGIITASDLYVYVRARVQQLTNTSYQIQTPGLFSMRKHEWGEFVFQTPSTKKNDPPPLTEFENPYRGLDVYSRADGPLLFGRDGETTKLIQRIEKRTQTLLVGGAGTGKSSLLAAKIVPHFEKAWEVVGPCRAMNVVNEGIELPATEKPLLLVIDQFEELITQRFVNDPFHTFQEVLSKVRRASTRVHLVAAIRSDFEPLLRTKLFTETWVDSRFYLAPMTQDQLRKVIEEPARAREIYFSPLSIVDQLINEVVLMPGALALLSLTLSSLYKSCWKRLDANPLAQREITDNDYSKFGVQTAVTDAAEQLLAELMKHDATYEYTVRNIMLRMISVEGGLPARRRVPRSMFDYSDDAENQRVRVALERLETTRLVIPVEGSEDEPRIEPAHDVLIMGWPRLHAWHEELREVEPTLRALEHDAHTSNQKKDASLLWTTDSRLPFVVPLIDEQTRRLNRIERDFVASSEKQRHDGEARRKKEQEDRTAELKRRTRVSIAVAVGIGALAVLLWFSLRKATEETKRADENAAKAVQKESEAKTEAIKARHAQLASEAQRASTLVALPGGWLEALPLAMWVAAQKTDETPLPPSVNGAVARAVFAAVPVVEVLSEPVRSLAITDDNVFATSRQGVTIWDVKTGNLAVQPTAFIPPQDGLSIDETGAVLATRNQEETRIWTNNPLTLRCPIPCTSASFSSNYSVLSQDGSTVMVACDDGATTFYNASSCQRISTIPAPPEQPSSPRFGPVGTTMSPDGRSAALPTETLTFWSVRSGKKLGEAVGKPYARAAFANVPFVLAVRASADDQRVDVWDFSNPARAKRLRTQAASSAAISPNGELIVVEHKGVIQVFGSRSDSKIIKTLLGRGLDSPMFSSDSQRVVAGGVDDLVRVWDIHRELTLAALRGHIFALSRSGRRLATWAHDGTIRIWSVEHTIVPAAGTISVVSFSPDRETMILGRSNGSASIRKRNAAAEVFIEPAHVDVLGARFSRDANSVLTFSAAEVRLSKVATGEMILRLPTREKLLSAELSPDGTKLLTATEHHPPQLWDVESGAEVDLYAGRLSRKPGAKALFIRGSNKLLLHGDEDVIVWDLQTQTGKALRDPKALPRVGAVAMALSDDGAHFLTVHDRTSHYIGLVWENAENALSSPREIDLGATRSDGHITVSFSSEGTRFVSTTHDSSVSVWETTTGALVKTLRVPAGTILHAELVRDGKRLLTLDSTNIARLWDVETGTEIGAFDQVSAAAITTDGSRFVGAYGGVLRSVSLEDNELFATACRLFAGLRTFPQLTASQVQNVKEACHSSR